MSERRKHHIEPLISELQISTRVKELAQAIASDFPEQSITLIGVLSGASTLVADLGRELWELGMNDVEIDYMAVDSYGGGTESNREPRIRMDTKRPIKDKNVILVEDIVDTGYSMEKLLELLKIRGAASLSVLALLSKEDRREVNVPIRYLGFKIPDKFVVGYGIDWDELYRNMPSIGVVVFDD